jgi:hypothetical protein
MTSLKAYEQTYGKIKVCINCSLNIRKLFPESGDDHAESVGAKESLRNTMTNDYTLPVEHLGQRPEFGISFGKEEQQLNTLAS